MSRTRALVFSRPTSPSTPASPGRCCVPARQLRHPESGPFGIYDRFSFRVPLGDHGDVYDRYMVRVLEMRESLKILQQALKEIPEGAIIDPKAKLRGFRPKAGEAYGRIEAPKGELAST